MGKGSDAKAICWVETVPFSDFVLFYYFFGCAARLMGS